MGVRVWDGESREHIQIQRTTTTATASCPVETISTILTNAGAGTLVHAARGRGLGVSGVAS